MAVIDTSAYCLSGACRAVWPVAQLSAAPQAAKVTYVQNVIQPSYLKPARRGSRRADGHRHLPAAGSLMLRGIADRLSNHRRAQPAASAGKPAAPPGMVKTFSCSAEKPDAVMMESTARMSSCVAGLKGSSQLGTWEGAAAGAASLAAASCTGGGGGLAAVGTRAPTAFPAAQAARRPPRAPCPGAAPAPRRPLPPAPSPPAA
jgi:hypothetical protein